MVDLKNVTVEQVERVIAEDDRDEKAAIKRMESGEDPWPADWYALKELTVKSSVTLEWLVELIDSVRGRAGQLNGAMIAPILLRAVVVGYKVAKAQMVDELEKAVH